METIDGFEKYKITESGDIFGPRGWALKPATTKDGYKMVSLYETEKDKRSFTVHRLVANAFVPNPEGLTEINHINGDKADNRAENLEWCSHADNMVHAARNNLIPKKMTEAGKALAKDLHFAGMKQRLIAKLFGVSPSYVSMLVRS